MMVKYTEHLWQAKIGTQFQLLGDTRIPNVTSEKIPIPLGICRETEVKVLSLLYKQNLLNLFISSVQRDQCESCMCDCMDDVQDAFHIVTSCKLVKSNLRNIVNTELAIHNNVKSIEDVTADYISLLNASRSKLFINACINSGE